MASLYRHKRDGWQVSYMICFPDGTCRKRWKVCSKKTKAVLMHQELDRFEVLAKKQRLSPEEITYALHQKYITRDEAMLLNADQSPLPVDISWDDLEKFYIKHLAKVGSDSTRANYRYIIRPVLRYFRGKSPTSVISKDIDGFIEEMRLRNRAKATCNKYLSALRTMFDHVVSIGYMKDNPARKVKDFRSLEERMPRVLYPGEMREFIKALDASGSILRGYFKEMILTYLYTGLRRHELLRIKVSDINWKHGYMRIEKTKNNRERIIQVHPDLVPVLQSVIEKNGDGNGGLLFGGKDAPLCRPDSVTWAFEKFRRRYLPKGVTLHSLRHTFITYLLRAGVDLKTVQTVAGHKRISTTYKYLHLIPSQDNVSKIDFEVGNGK